MFISREYDYALRILRVLSGKEQMTVKEICDAEHIPQPYSYKILKKLEKAEIVRGRRGTMGGYQMVLDAEDVSLYDIYVAIEGEMYINECMHEGYDCPHQHAGQVCCIHKELCQLQNYMVTGLKERTMADMLN